VESKYTIFERLTWMLMEVVKTVCLVLMDQCLLIRSPASILDWINMKGEALAGTPSEPKVLQCKWFLSEFLNNHKIMAKGKTALWVEEIASALMVPGRWGTERDGTTRKQTPGSLMDHPCCGVASCIGNLQPGDPQMGKSSQTKARVDQCNMRRSMQPD
jgi:hypothetical protein